MDQKVQHMDFCNLLQVYTTNVELFLHGEDVVMFFTFTNNDLYMNVHLYYALNNVNMSQAKCI